MMEIRYYGDPVLRRHTAPVRRFDRELARLARAMLDTMYAMKGVGLAGPQVGVQRQIFVLDVSEDRDRPQVIVNPRIIQSEGRHEDEEGCLSIPGLHVDVQRAETIELEYQDLEGNLHTEPGNGLWARAVQHEKDHLDGRLIVDFMSARDREAFEAEWPAMKARALAEKEETAAEIPSPREARA
jgi:peptide deformylase